MQKPSFTKKPLAAGIALALGAGLTGAAVAQESTDDEVIEEIVTVPVFAARCLLRRQ